MTCAKDRSLRALPTAFAVLITAALCGSARVMAEEPKTTPDGLQKVEASRVDLAYQRPGTEWTKYKTAQILPLVIPPGVRLEPGGEDLLLSDEDAAALQQSYADVWRAELQKEGFAVVDAPRTDTLIIKAELTDMIANAPGPTPGTTVSGSVAIKLAMADGSTNKTVATAADRKFAHYLVEDPTHNSNLAQVRDAFRNWAHILAQDLRERTEAPKVDPWLCLTERKLCPPGVLTPR